jgi:hypothetical protein
MSVKKVEHVSVSPVFLCPTCPPPNALSMPLISELRKGNGVWCGTCGTFLGYDVVVPDQFGSLLASLSLDCNMHLYRKLSNNVPVRACDQDVHITALTLIDRIYTRFRIELQWFEISSTETKQGKTRKDKPLSDHELFIEMLPEPVRPALKKFCRAGFVLTQSNLDGKAKQLRLECRYPEHDQPESKCLVVRAELTWPDDLLNPPPEPPKKVITLAAAKKIFWKAAQDSGIPTPKQYPRTADPKERTKALQAMCNATQQSMSPYLPDGQVLSCMQQTRWIAEILEEAGWKVAVSLDELRFEWGYPDNCSQ